jgi:hypothetical protein
LMFLRKAFFEGDFTRGIIFSSFWRIP